MLVVEEATDCLASTSEYWHVHHATFIVATLEIDLLHIWIADVDWFAWACVDATVVQFQWTEAFVQVFNWLAWNYLVWIWHIDVLDVLLYLVNDCEVNRLMKIALCSVLFIYGLLWLMSLIERYVCALSSRLFTSYISIWKETCSWCMKNICLYFLGLYRARDKWKFKWNYLRISCLCFIIILSRLLLPLFIGRPVNWANQVFEIDCSKRYNFTE